MEKSGFAKFAFDVSMPCLMEAQHGQEMTDEDALFCPWKENTFWAYRDSNPGIASLFQKIFDLCP